MHYIIMIPTTCAILTNTSIAENLSKKSITCLVNWNDDWLQRAHSSTNYAWNNYSLIMLSIFS